jgi:hypothetical protein
VRGQDAERVSDLVRDGGGERAELGQASRLIGARFFAGQRAGEIGGGRAFDDPAAERFLDLLAERLEGERGGEE